MCTVLAYLDFMLSLILFSQFGVIAKDRGLPQLASNMLVITLIVDDINDNLPYFPADKQTVEVEVPEEEAGVAIGSVDYARDADERQIFCYYIIGEKQLGLQCQGMSAKIFHLAECYDL